MVGVRVYNLQLYSAEPHFIGTHFIIYHNCASHLTSRLCDMAATAARAAGKRVAVVLSGCGVFDGAEIHEASAILVALSRHNAQYQVLILRPGQYWR